MEKTSAIASRASVSDCSIPPKSSGAAGLGEGGAAGGEGAAGAAGGVAVLALGGVPLPSEMFNVTVLPGPSWIADTTVPAGEPLP